MNIGYIIAAYFGKRGGFHTNINTDKLFYIRKQLEYLKKLETPITNLYIVCTFDSNENQTDIISELENLVKGESFISIHTRDNLGGSYCSWKFGLDVDNNKSDYILLLEDDYVVYDCNAVNYLLSYFNDNQDLFYLCQFWNKNPYSCAYYNTTIPEHAALSIGMINNKLYNKYKNENGIDFKLTYDTGYTAMWANQASFLENYRMNGIKIMDFTDKYSAYYPHSFIDYGVSDGPIIFQPIINQFFN